MGFKKYSISLPEELADKVRELAGPGEFSAYIAHALDREIAMHKLREIVDDYLVDHEPFTEEERAEARALLSHESGESGGSATEQRRSDAA